jgi:hypothetical protein
MFFRCLPQHPAHFNHILPHIYLIDIHATNVAIQKKSPNYSSKNGCKWLLRSLKQYMYAHHESDMPGAVDECFRGMENIILKSLQSVKGVMINDKHCFEIYGYDILIDDSLRPWLLEVNASPSLSAETQFDYELKYSMLNDAFDIIDLERKNSPKNSGEVKIPCSSGGFDLVYSETLATGGGGGGENSNGTDKSQPPMSFSSLMGAHCPVGKQKQKSRFKNSSREVGAKDE